MQLCMQHTVTACTLIYSNYGAQTCHVERKCDSTYWSGQVGPDIQNWVFAISLTAVLSAQFWCKNVWNCILHSSDMVILLMMS